MAQETPIDHSNLLLRGLPGREIDLLASRGRAVTFGAGTRLLRASDELHEILFVESGLVSVVGAANRERAMDVCLIGREGAVGAEAALEAGRASQEHVAQLDVQAFRVPLEILATGEAPVLHRRLLRFLRILLVQSMDSAVSCGTSTIEVRLARWLLMCHDRIPGDEIQVTHVMLSKALGVRRAGITVALHMLEGERLIRSLRERIIIRDRLGLEQAAHGTYGHAEAEYERLLGPQSALGRPEGVDFHGPRPAGLAAH